MADNATTAAGSNSLPAGTTILADEVTDATLGTGLVQLVKVVDGTLDGTSKAAVGANGLSVDVKASSGQKADAAAGVPAVLYVVGGYDGTNVRRMSTDASGVQNINLASAIPAGANVIGALSANQSINNAQVAGNAVDTNSGTKSAGTQRVVLATDQPQLTNALKVDGSAVTQPVSGSVSEVRPSSSSVTQVASSATSVTLKASNASRRGLYVYNDSTQVLYLKLGATASSTSFTVQLAAQSYWELPAPYYTGVVDGIWAAANGNAYVTEIS